MGGATKKSDAKNGKKILDPGELDVLCGRGGMSNHHPGNEWYRRLVKSNRPLYRACPKHTKLLVSKAIVQAVEQQGGRFLEKNRDDGSWYEVTYKRAVDKTSQGLRERERDDDVKDGGAAKGAVAVPEQFSGRRGQKTPDLSDLADVAIAHAHRTDGLPRKASDLITPPAGVAATAAAATGAPLSAVGLKPQQVPAASTSPSGRPTSVLKKKRPLPMQQEMVAHTNKRTRGDGGGDEDFAPLPPGLQKRESSMFRMLKQTKLLLQQSESWQQANDLTATAARQAPNINMIPPHMMGAARPAVASTTPATNSVVAKSKYPTKLNNLSTAATAASASEGSRNNNPNAASVAPSRGKGARQLGRMSVTQFNNSSEMTPTPLVPGTTQFVAAPMAQGPTAAPPVPALTRLTSQVSDWLTSFFPVATRGESVANPVAMAAAAAASTQHQASYDPFMGGSGNVMDGLVGGSSQQNRALAQQLVRIPPQVTTPQINTIPPMKQRGSGSSESMESASDGASQQQQMGRRSKRKSQSNMPQLPFDTARHQGVGGGPAGPLNMNVDHDSLPPAPAPTELEQSVSATLLKLAGTPSKLYSGLSSFFGKSTAGPMPPPAATTNAPDNGGTIMGGTKRSSASLLDDDDEEEDQAAAAAAAMQPQHMMPPHQPKRSSASLLDDHEETPMEQRMRAVAWGRH